MKTFVKELVEATLSKLFQKGVITVNLVENNIEVRTTSNVLLYKTNV